MYFLNIGLGFQGTKYFFNFTYNKSSLYFKKHMWMYYFI